MRRALSPFAFGLVILTWGLLVFGASVRVNDAGLACPDWPLCFGEVIPTIDTGVFFEFGHRVVAGIVSLVFLALGIAAWRQKFSARILGLWALGAVVLTIQVILGGLTVLELLAEWTVASHLLVGNTFTLILLLFALALKGEEGGWPSLDATTWAQRSGPLLLGALLPVQLILGGFVSSSHAGLVCPSWPDCAGGVWFPTLSGLVGLQIAHRFVGYAIAAAALYAFGSSMSHRHLRAPAALVFGLVLLQISIGIGNVLLLLPVSVTLAHTGVGALVVLSTTWLGWRSFRAPLGSPTSVSHGVAMVSEAG